MHTFCLECLQSFVKNTNDRRLPCPLCKVLFTVPQKGVKTIPNNILATQLLDKLPEKGTPSTICQEHDEDGMYYLCKTCIVPLCVDCMVDLDKGKHKDHDVETVQGTAVHKITQEYHGLKVKVEKVDQDSSKTLDTISKTLEQRKDEAITSVQARTERVIAEAIEWNNKVLKEITGAFDKVTSELQSIQNGIQQVTEAMAQKMSDIERYLRNTDVLNSKKQVDLLKEDLDNMVSVTPSSEQISFGQLSDSYTVNLGEFELSLPNFPTIKVTGE